MSAPIPQRAGPPDRILLVEDDAGDARMLSLWVAEGASAPVEVDVRASLAEGLRSAASRRPSAVLLDLGLPDSSGVPTFLAIRDAVESPVLVITGDPDAAAAAVHAGAEESLVKGTFDGRTLTQAIRHAVERHRIRLALQRKAAGFRAIVDSHLDGVVVVDADGLILYVNRAAEELFGLQAAQLVGSNFGFPLAHGTTTVRFARPGGGRTAWGSAELRVVPTEWNGHPAHAGFLRDIRTLEREQDALARIGTTPDEPSPPHAACAAAPFSRPAFPGLLGEYAALLAAQIENRFFKADESLSARISAFARRLVGMDAGPREAIELHTSALRDALHGAEGAKARSYLDEGRLLLLQLMGCLVAAYRARRHPVPQPPGKEPTCHES